MMARGKKQTTVKAAVPETAGKAAEKKGITQTEPMKRAAEELAKVVAEETKEVPASAAVKAAETAKKSEKVTSE